MLATARQDDSKIYEVYEGDGGAEQNPTAWRYVQFDGVDVWSDPNDNSEWADWGYPKMLPWGFKTIFFNQTRLAVGTVQDDFSSATASFSALFSDFVLLNEQDGYTPLGFDGLSKYAVMITRLSTGQKQISYSHDLSDRGFLHQKLQAVEFKISLVNYSTIPLNDLRYQIYRLDDNLETGRVDSDYYRVSGQVELGVTNVLTYRDEYPSTDKYGNEVLNTTLVGAQLSGSQSASWWQGRVIWGENLGAVTISNRDDPFVTTVDNRDRPLFDQHADVEIVHMVELLDSLIFLTNKGIFNMIGDTADDALDSTVKIYHAKQNVQFVAAKNTVIVDDWIYAIADNGIYKYNGRNLVLVSDKLRPLFHDFTAADYAEMELGFDYINRRLFWKVDDRDTYVYHMKGETWQGGTFTAGPWTKCTANITTIDIGLPSNFGAGSSHDELVPLFAHSATNICYLHEDLDLNVESVISYLWQSKDFDGGTQYRKKKWRELRVAFHTEVEHTLSVVTNASTFGITVDDKEDFFRLRTGERSRFFNFKLIGSWDDALSQEIAFSGFGIEAELIGV